MVLYDSVRDRQPQAGTLTDRLGGKERVEDLASDGLGDARSGVANRDQKNSEVWLVVMTIVPSPTMASTALAIKFINTWWSRPA